MARQEIPAVRIWPMSDKIPGFRGRTIEDVQQRTFLRDLPKNGGRFTYRSAGLNARAGTIVLFQFAARIIASGVFVRDERFDRPTNGSAGVIHFEPKSFRVFNPIDAQTMRAAWPQFRNFGHVKQHLNPTRYAAFKRRLKNVESPAS
jgi:hypothetical protein